MQTRDSLGGHSRSAGLRAGSLAVAAGAVLACGAPAFAIAEAIQSICPDGPQTEVVCPWYRGGRGPLISAVLPPAQQILTGTRSVIGLIDGFLPLSTHEVFDDGAGGTRVRVEIVGGLGEGDPNNGAHVSLRSRATGVLSVAAGNGTPSSPEPLARGVAFTSRMYAASVASAAGLNNTFTTNVPGLLASMLIMADPATGPAWGVTQPADVIVSAFAYLGDYEAEGDIARIHDAVAFMFGTTLVAPVGDGGLGPFPPTMPELAFRTVGTPAAAFNTIAVGGSDIVPPTPGPLDGDGSTTDGTVSGLGYERIWPRSGRGRTDARDWRTRDTAAPSGFRVILNARMGPDIIAPADRLRTGTALGEGAYSREPSLPPQGPDFPPEGPGTNGTAAAAGFVAGGAALLQDAYKALRDTGLFPQWTSRPRMHNTVVKALLLNSASKSGLWTNQGNQGTQGSTPQQFTTQPLDTLEGAGQLQLSRLFDNFQGRQAQPPFRPELLASLDPEITDPNLAAIRDPRSITGGDDAGADGAGGGGGDPPLGGGGEDPPLGGGRPGPVRPPNGPFIPEPGGSPPTFPPNPPPPPGQLFLNGAIPVHSIGWDHGRIGVGFLDYACMEPAVGGDVFTATLCWNRTEQFIFPSVVPGAAFPGFNVQAAETQLELENLGLEVYLHDGSGGPRLFLGSSNSDWAVTEHVFLANNSVPAFGLPLVRVRWVNNRYNQHPGGQLFVADTEFGVAWNLVLGPTQNTGNAPPGTPSTLLPGDLNGDGRVDIGDLATVLSGYGTGNLNADANFDGIVDFRDLAIVLANFGAAINPVPTP